MAVLDRNAILSAADLDKELVPVPEWGGEVWIRALTADERDSYEAAMIWVDTSSGRPKAIPKFEKIRASLVALCIVDEEGERLFNENDVDALGAKSAAAVDRLFDVARRLSRLSAEDIKELVGDLEETPDDATA